MHIKSSSGEQITLTFLDLNTTVNEQVRVYDHPSSTTYLVGSFRGDLQEGDAVIVSSRGGITLVYEDDSDSANGPGFLAQTQIQGVHVFFASTWCLNLQISFRHILKDLIQSSQSIQSYYILVRFGRRFFFLAAMNPSL